jgi:biotin transport system substrate-specific component
MNANDSGHRPLALAFWPADGRPQMVLRGLILTVLGCGLLVISAKTQVPFWPVSMSMQTLAVLLIGFTYGSRLAAATVLVYLLLGILDVPVFVGYVAGPDYFKGPTGGYLVGFLIASVLLGILAERGWDRRFATSLPALLLANALIYVPGVFWLAGFLGSFDRAIAGGVVPFLLGDALKLAMVGSMVLAARLVADYR